MIAQNQCKITQLTYLRQNLHDQVKCFEKYVMIIDYLPCQCEIPIQNSFWPQKLFLSFLRLLISEYHESNIQSKFKLV